MMRRTSIAAALAVAAVGASTMSHASASVPQFEKRFDGYPWLRVSAPLAAHLARTAASGAADNTAINTHCAVYVESRQHVLCPNGEKWRVFMTADEIESKKYYTYKARQLEPFTYFSEWTPIKKSVGQQLEKWSDGAVGFEWDKAMWLVGKTTYIVEPNGHITTS